MRKQIKLAVVAAAAAILALGVSFASFAYGWEGNTWLDKNGDRVTNCFKASGSNYYYLNDDGEVEYDALVEYNDNLYYVDANGVMVTNTFVSYQGEDDDDPYWYYFQASGKAYQSGQKKITWNGTTNSYVFDEYKMLTGWIKYEDNAYSSLTNDEGTEYQTVKADSEDDLEVLYASEDGALVKSNWINVTCSKINAENMEDDYWFFFDKNGYRVAALDDGIANNEDTYGLDYTYNKCKWDGKTGYFLFNEFGVMLSSTWGQVGDINNDGVTGDLVYVDANGYAVSGWQELYAANADSTLASSSKNWYYFDKYHAAYAGKLVKISGKYYAFATDGAMLKGVQALTFADDSTSVITNSGASSGRKFCVRDLYVAGTNYIKANGYDYTNIYYFGNDGAMKTGSQEVTLNSNYTADTSTTTVTMLFATTGKAVIGAKGSNLYANGVKVEASASDKGVILKGYDYDGDAADVNDTVYFWKQVSNTDTEFVGYAVYDKYSNVIGWGADTSVLKNATEKYELSDIARSEQYAILTDAGTLVKSGTKTLGNGDKVRLSASRVIGYWHLY